MEIKIDSLKTDKEDIKEIRRDQIMKIIEGEEIQQGGKKENNRPKIVMTLIGPLRKNKIRQKSKI